MRDHRPEVLLEIAPHSSLQPVIAQCLEGGDPVPACIPTLMRDTDVCLGFHQALGALFRAGVELDFAAQYPRPEPVAHRLPGYPREDQATIDLKCDDEMFLRQGGYSQGPLIGRKVPSDHLLFEARLSDEDFPWLTEHLVHYAAIMPAAGYIELILQAFAGAPIHMEVLEFLQPCPIPKTPVRLQTELRPLANVPDAYTFTISSRSYEVEAGSELHCRGKVRLLKDDQAVDVPARLEEIDTTRFERSVIADESDCYERFEAALSETFQYGPHFRTMKRVRMDMSTRAYLVDVEMDERLWRTGREEGYVASVPMLDGGLQIFLYNLMLGADHFAITPACRTGDVSFVLQPRRGSRFT